MSEKNKIIELKNVYKEYDDVQVVDNINLYIQKNPPLKKKTNG